MHARQCPGFPSLALEIPNHPTEMMTECIDHLQAEAALLSIVSEIRTELSRAESDSMSQPPDMEGLAERWKYVQAEMSQFRQKHDQYRKPSKWKRTQY